MFITGASSGLGAALAKEHAVVGHGLVLFARRVQKMRALATVCMDLGASAVLVCAGDVGRRRDLDRAVKHAERSLGGIDIVYANAGYSQSGSIERLSIKQWRNQMQVNVEGVFHTVQVSLPLLKQRRGRLVLIGSVAGFGSTAETGAYAASKAAVRSMAQILDLELAPAGVSVTYVAPGFFASEIRLKDSDGREVLGKLEYIPSFILGNTARLAFKIRKAVEARRFELIEPRHARLATFFMRHVPAISQHMIRRIGLVRNRRKSKIQGK